MTNDAQARMHDARMKEHVLPLLQSTLYLMNHLSLYSNVLYYGPTMGALNAESPPNNFATIFKNMGAKQALQPRIRTIFCMRKTTYISNEFRMRAGPLSP